MSSTSCRSANRFIPGLRSWLGFKQTSVFYDRQDRAAGKPKQTLRRLVKYAMDGMVSFSYKPLRAATYMGPVSIVAFGVGGVLLHQLLHHSTSSRQRVHTTIDSACCSSAAVQMITDRHPRRVRRPNLRGDQAAPAVRGAGEAWFVKPSARVRADPSPVASP
jgi:hypothetical protein